MVTLFFSAGHVSIVWGIWSRMENNNKENPTPLCTQNCGGRAAYPEILANFGTSFQTSFWYNLKNLETTNHNFAT